ncbi:hypothetical protein [Cryobacterium sp. Y11]|uniref:hypothetical protein n=1 Tax=Cryobacterium sp. Y11 TaxID=2045016 RepID=UPI001304A077|nr:hypothetical protein [Cryobacterium sp. Y11]
MADWSISHPRARKAHRCEMCRRVIGAGEVYKRGAGFDGTAWSWKECLHCEAVLRIYGLGDGEYNADSFEDWASDGDARDLSEARDMAGFRKQWRTKAGNLWPLPAPESPATSGGES